MLCIQANWELIFTQVAIPCKLHMKKLLLIALLVSLTILLMFFTWHGMKLKLSLGIPLNK